MYPGFIWDMGMLPRVFMGLHMLPSYVGIQLSMTLLNNQDSVESKGPRFFSCGSVTLGLEKPYILRVPAQFWDSNSKN